jgi:hypothetical protein
MSVVTRQRITNLTFSANCNAAWRECWNMKIREGKTQGRIRSDKEDALQLQGRDNPFANNVTYLGVASDKRMTLKLYIERTVVKACAHR